tara:strand:- start:5 stop:499 length:495 start_codon:yes stop_codon:yes gene_type:complete
MILEKNINIGLHLGEQVVLKEWIDYNNHMNVAFYVLAFDRGVDRLMDTVGITSSYINQQNNSMFTLEMRVHYLKELLAGDVFYITCQLLDLDSKRIHYFLRMYNQKEGFLAAESEQLMMHINLESRKSISFPKSIKNNLTNIFDAHKKLIQPDKVSQKIGIRRT